MCDLDLDDLIHARSKGTVTPRLDRRPDLFKIVTRLAVPAATVRVGQRSAGRPTTAP